MSVKRHKIRARCRAVEVGEKHCYTFEMLRPIFNKATGKLNDGGVRFKRYRSRAWTLVTFATIAEGARTVRTVEGRDTSFVIGENGLEVRIKGESGSRIIAFEELANLGRRQPLLLK